MVLEQMYGSKKKDVCVYQLMKDTCSLHQEEKSMDDYYRALK